MKMLLAVLLLLPIFAQAAPGSKLFMQLIDRVNVFKASSSRSYMGGYPLSESPGYNYFKIEELGQSKESLQKLLRAGHKYKDKGNRFHHSIPGYPASEMSRVKMTVADLLGDIHYADEELAQIAKSLGYKDELLDANNMLTDDAFYFLEETTLNVTTFRKVVKVLEPETNLDIFK